MAKAATILTNVRKAVEAKKTETGERNAAARILAKYGIVKLPQVEEGATTTGGKVRVYRWDGVGDERISLLLIAGPSFEAEVRLEDEGEWDDAPAGGYIAMSEPSERGKSRATRGMSRIAQRAAKRWEDLGKVSPAKPKPKRKPARKKPAAKKAAPKKPAPKPKKPAAKKPETTVVSVSERVLFPPPGFEPIDNNPFGAHRKKTGQIRLWMPHGADIDAAIEHHFIAAQKIQAAHRNRMTRTGYPKDKAAKKRLADHWATYHELRDGRFKTETLGQQRRNTLIRLIEQVATTGDEEAAEKAVRQASAQVARSAAKELLGSGANAKSALRGLIGELFNEFQDAEPAPVRREMERPTRAPFRPVLVGGLDVDEPTFAQQLAERRKMGAERFGPLDEASLAPLRPTELDVDSEEYAYLYERGRDFFYDEILVEIGNIPLTSLEFRDTAAVRTMLEKGAVEVGVTDPQEIAAFVAGGLSEYPSYARWVYPVEAATQEVWERVTGSEKNIFEWPQTVQGPIPDLFTAMVEEVLDNEDYVANGTESVDMLASWLSDVFAVTGAKWKRPEKYQEVAKKAAKLIPIEAAAAKETIFDSVKDYLILDLLEDPSAGPESLGIEPQDFDNVRYAGDVTAFLELSEQLQDGIEAAKSGLAARKAVEHAIRTKKLAEEYRDAALEVAESYGGIGGLKELLDAHNFTRTALAMEDLVPYLGYDPTLDPMKQSEHRKGLQELYDRPASKKPYEFPAWVEETSLFTQKKSEPEPVVEPEPVDVVYFSFPSLNKQSHLEGYLEQPVEDWQKTRGAVVDGVHVTPERWMEIATNLMDAIPEIAGKGGSSSTTDPYPNDDTVKWTDLTGAEKQQWRKGAYRKITAIYAPGKPPLFVDPQGYDYARYVGFLPMGWQTIADVREQYRKALEPVVEPEPASDLQKIWEAIIQASVEDAKGRYPGRGNLHAEIRDQLKKQYRIMRFGPRMVAQGKDVDLTVPLTGEGDEEAVQEAVKNELLTTLSDIPFETRKVIGANDEIRKRFVYAIYSAYEPEGVPRIVWTTADPRLDLLADVRTRSTKTIDGETWREVAVFGAVHPQIYRWESGGGSWSYEDPEKEAKRRAEAIQRTQDSLALKEATRKRLETMTVDEISAEYGQLAAILDVDEVNRAKRRADAERVKRKQAAKDAKLVEAYNEKIGDANAILEFSGGPPGQSFIIGAFGGAGAVVKANMPRWPGDKVNITVDGRHLGNATNLYQYVKTDVPQAVWERMKAEPEKIVLLKHKGKDYYGRIPTGFSKPLFLTPTGRKVGAKSVVSALTQLLKGGRTLQKVKPPPVWLEWNEVEAYNRRPGGLRITSRGEENVYIDIPGIGPAFIKVHDPDTFTLEDPGAQFRDEPSPAQEFDARNKALREHYAAAYTEIKNTPWMGAEYLRGLPSPDSATFAMDYVGRDLENIVQTVDRMAKEVKEKREAAVTTLTPETLKDYLRKTGGRVTVADLVYAFPDAGGSAKITALLQGMVKKGELTYLLVGKSYGLPEPAATPTQSNDERYQAMVTSALRDIFGE